MKCTDASLILLLKARFFLEHGVECIFVACGFHKPGTSSINCQWLLPLWRDVNKMNVYDVLEGIILLEFALFFCPSIQLAHFWVSKLYDGCTSECPCVSSISQIPVCMWFIGELKPRMSPIYNTHTHVMSLILGQIQGIRLC